MDNTTLNVKREKRTLDGRGATLDTRRSTLGVRRSTAARVVPSPPTLRTSALPNFRTPAAARRGFTLVEMLTVIAIISILIGFTGVALVKAREMARRTRADTELREMVSAWLQYQQLYEEWPSAVKGKVNIPASQEILNPLIDNPREIVLLNLKLPKDQATFNDPWGTPYQLSFDSDAEGVKNVTAMRTSITFMNRQRRFP